MHRTWKQLQGYKVTVGVNNIANRMPSKSATFDSLSNADITEFNPVGRLYYVSDSAKFLSAGLRRFNAPFTPGRLFFARPEWGVTSVAAGVPRWIVKISGHKPSRA